MQYKQKSTFIRTINSILELQNALCNIAHHNTQKNHNAVGSFWATPDERVSRSGMHYSTIT
jgi:hypothetical protein